MGQITSWLYCVEYPQYSIRLESLGYLFGCPSGRVHTHKWSKYFDFRRIAAVDGWFNRIRQLAAMCPPMRVHWRHLANTIELRPTRLRNPNGKLIASAVLAQLTVESAYTLQWEPLSTRIAPSHGGSGPPSNA